LPWQHLTSSPPRSMTPPPQVPVLSTLGQDQHGVDGP
jgi:hypothetical protein